MIPPQARSSRRLAVVMGWCLASATAASISCGCGGPKAEASSSQPTVPATSALVPAIASTPLAGQASALPSPGASEEGNPESGPASQAASAPSSDQEQFPSGLVVSQRFLGGGDPGPDLPLGTRVLHIGDSFGGALGIELGKLLTARGVKNRLAFETSTYIPTWAWDSKLTSLLQSFKPDLVLISLGANELDNPEPTKRIPTIRHLVERIAPTPCVWVAPVLWASAKPQLLEVISKNIFPCVYLDSNAMVSTIPRMRDGIHPSMASRPDWAKAVLRWLAYHRQAGEGRPWQIREEP
jgi:hypothetical protein